VLLNGSFTLATFVGKTIGNSNLRQAQFVLALATLGGALAKVSK